MVAVDAAPEILENRLRGLAQGNESVKALNWRRTVQG